MMRAAVIRSLRKAGRYSAGLDFQVEALASALHTLWLANSECDGLERATIENATKEGKRTVIHPAIKARQIAEQSITAQVKNLGLTMEGLMSEVECDPLVELTREMTEAGSAGVLMPDD